MEFKAGQKFKAQIPFGAKPMKIHICYVLPSKAYKDETLIIYKVYGKHKQYWHEFMCTKELMKTYIDIAK